MNYAYKTCFIRSFEITNTAYWTIFHASFRPNVFLLFFLYTYVFIYFQIVGSQYGFDVIAGSANQKRKEEIKNKKQKNTKTQRRMANGENSIEKIENNEHNENCNMAHRILSSSR